METSSNIIRNKYKTYSTRAVIMVFLSYTIYCLYQENFNVTTPFLVKQLHFTKVQIGLIASTFSFSYAIGKIVLGIYLDRVNSKKAILLGLIGASITSVLLGFPRSVPVFVGLMLFNGVFVAISSPAGHIAIGKWFSKKERGFTMSIVNISHNIGAGLVGPLANLAILLFGVSGFRWIFFIPAIISIVFIILIFFIGVDSPESVGLPSMTEFKENNKLDSEVTTMSSFEIFKKYVLKNKYIWILMPAIFSIFVIKRGVADWLPLYLTEFKHFSPQESNWVLFTYQYSAIPITLIVGWLSDKFFKGNRAPLAIISMVGVVLALILYWMNDNYILTLISASLISICTYSPFLLLSVSVMDVVPEFAIGSADGFSGVAGVLFAFSNYGLGYITQYYGWNASMVFIIVGALIGVISLLVLQYIYKKDGIF